MGIPNLAEIFCLHLWFFRHGLMGNFYCIDGFVVHIPLEAVGYGFSNILEFGTRASYLPLYWQLGLCDSSAALASYLPARKQTVEGIHGCFIWNCLVPDGSHSRA